MKSFLAVVVGAACLAPLPFVLVAAGADASATPGSSPDESPVNLDAYVVSDVPVQQSVNPLVRPIGSVLGDDLSILDTPRNVVSISPELIHERGIDGLGPILQYAPGAYAPARYGKLEVPNIRGDSAELYQNGQRMADNLYGIFPSFNDVDSVDIVSGPASAIYGPGYLTGGYVNFVTKQPSLENEHTELTYRMGNLVSGGLSFFQSSWQVDTSVPIIKDKLAVRVSYEGKAGQTFFKELGYYDDREDLFIAVAYRPSDDLKIDFNAQYIYQRSPESGGINRPWQGLIDNGTYFTGLAADGEGAPGPLTPTGTAQIKPNDGLFSKAAGDSAQANVWRSQLIVTKTFNPNLFLKNLAYFEDIDRRRYSAYEYVEYVPIDRTFDDRLELHSTFGTDKFKSEAIFGAEFRYEERESYANYYNEYVYNWDVTNPSSNYDFAANYPGAYTPGLVGPGGHYFFNDNNALLDTPETTHSKLSDFSLFYQHTLQLGDQWAAIAGVRGDLYHVTASSPLLAPGDAPLSNSLHTFDPSFNASITYKPSAWVTAYISFNRVKALAGNTTGGGTDLDSDGQIAIEDFKNQSTLYEAGLKLDLIKNTLFLATDVYDQKRERIQRGAGPLDIRVKGVETQVVYQPIQRLFAIANATFAEANFVNSAPFELGGASIYDQYALGTGPDGLGTGVGPFGDQVAPGNYRVPGFSRMRFNGQVSYELPSGFGGSIAYLLQSPQNGNLLDQFEIPWQHTINVSIFYRTKTWQANVDISNLTNEKNWAHNGDTLMDNQLISREMPLNISGYIKLTF